MRSDFLTKDSNLSSMIFIISNLNSAKFPLERRETTVTTTPPIVERAEITENRTISHMGNYVTSLKKFIVGSLESLILTLVAIIL